jgi:hypothetical protein
MPPKRESPVLVHRRHFVERAIRQGVRSIDDLSHELLLDAYNLLGSESKCARRSSSLINSDDDLSDEDPSLEIKKMRRKGKGKMDPNVCSKDGCAHDPKCLNWLGQKEWLDKGMLCSSRLGVLS